MGWKNREIEVKALVSGVSTMSQLDALVLPFITETCPDFEVISSKSFDLYWPAPNGSIADFVRLRRYAEDKAQVTIKASDRGDNIDRVEMDLEVEDYKQANNILSALFGNSTKLSKKYIVYFLENEDTTISLYQVTGDARLFVEVEARSKTRVKALLTQLSALFPAGAMYRIDKSLYQMFIQKVEPTKTAMEDFLKEF